MDIRPLIYHCGVNLVVPVLGLLLKVSEMISRECDGGAW